MPPPTLVFRIGALLPLAAPLRADLYVTNFTALDGTAGASGVWRNQTTGTDLPVAVSISQAGGTVKPADGSSTQSRIDDSFPWQPLPLIAGGANAFSPNFDGDYINIETQEGNSTTVTLEFGAEVTDPVISFTDVEYRTTITFPNEFTVIESTSNLTATATSVSSDGTEANSDSFGLFGEEAARFAPLFRHLRADRIHGQRRNRR